MIIWDEASTSSSQVALKLESVQKKIAVATNTTGQIVFLKDLLKFRAKDQKGPDAAQTELEKKWQNRNILQLVQYICKSIFSDKTLTM